MNVIVLDDDEVMVLIMKKILKKIKGINIVTTFNDIREVISLLKKSKVDMAFLDINMPVGNGFDLAKKILEISPNTDIVFTTSCREYAVEAFDICAFDYILKPILPERLERTVKRSFEKRISTSNKKQKKDDPISIYLFGGIDVTSKHSGTIKWISAKSIELFTYLLLKEGHSVSKNMIIEEIFFEMPLKNAENYLKTSIYQIRKALEPYCSKSVLISNNGCYKIDISAFYIDFIDFQKRISKINKINLSNIKEALYVEKLFTGELLGDRLYYWSIPEKEKYLNLYLNLLKKLGEYYFRNGDVNQASYFIKKILKFDQTNEDANYLLMKIFASQRDKDGLAKHFERYKKVMKQELDILPESTLVNLYEKLIKNF